MLRNLTDGANSKVQALNPYTAAWPIKQPVGVLPGVPTNDLQPTFITCWNSPSSWKHTVASHGSIRSSYNCACKSGPQIIINSVSAFIWKVPWVWYLSLCSKLHMYTCTSKLVKIQQ